LLASGLVLINNGYVELIDGEASTQTKGWRRLPGGIISKQNLGWSKMGQLNGLRWPSSARWAFSHFFSDSILFLYFLFLSFLFLPCVWRFLIQFYKFVLQEFGFKTSYEIQITQYWFNKLYKRNMGMCNCTYNILNTIKIFSGDLNGWIQINFKEHSEYCARWWCSNYNLCLDENKFTINGCSNQWIPILKVWTWFHVFSNFLTSMKLPYDHAKALMGSE
jgi:hypothetical protein